MPYVSGGGRLQDSQSPWRLSIVYDSFWALVNFVVLFFQTMLQPDLTKHGQGYQSSYSAGPQGPPDGYPRRRMGGFRRNTGPAAPPAGGGG